MILTIFLAASLQASAPVTTSCTVTPEGISRNRSVPRSLTVECPTQVVEAEQLQTLAEGAVGRIPLNLHRRIHLQFATQIWFQWYPGDTWRAFPGQVVVGALSRPEDAWPMPVIGGRIAPMRHGPMKTVSRMIFPLPAC